MLVIELGMVTPVSLEQSLNAPLSILVTANVLLLYVTFAGMVMSPAYPISPLVTEHVMSVNDVTL